MIRVSLLHPVDLLVYTALTLLVKDDLESFRVPRARNIVYSYRTEAGVPNRLYGQQRLFTSFQERLEQRSRRSAVKYVAIADIADFYPRINQHRLENVIESCAKSERSKDVARVLVRKLISNLSGKNSYGIPVGPYASRILGEAVLIDVDSYLISESLDFVRWVDDYFFFTRTEQQAQDILIGLAERLYDKHGLTLSALKTKIQSSHAFVKRFDANPQRKVDSRIATIKDFSSRIDPYSDEEIPLSDEERTELAELDFAELIAEALEDRDLVDYDTLSALLRHPELLSMLPVQSRRNLGDVLLRNVEHLYPIAGEVAGFFSSFVDESVQGRKRAKAKLLSSIQPKHGKWPPDYYVMWVLSIFGRGEAWGEAPDFVRIFRDHRSDVVRRAAALAIAENGTRADAVEAKDRFAAASPLERLAILLAARRLGKDERKHWKTSLQLTGPLEKRV
jgi:hypothetical protein